MNDSLSTTELTTLRTLANKCPDWDGNGVFMARALLSLFDSIGTVYSDSCHNNENFQKMVKAPRKSETDSTLFNLYPNPNNGGFTLVYTLQKGQTGEFKIFNLIGQKVSDYSLDNHNTMMLINENSLSNGIYLYEIIVNSKPVKKR